LATPTPHRDRGASAMMSSPMNTSRTDASPRQLEAATGVEPATVVR
jgi:hypothetical protein